MDEVSTSGPRLRRRLSPGAGDWPVPRWTALALLLAGVLLVPWSALLFVMLPRDYAANNWHLAWGGFDVCLAVALAATAVALIRRSPLVPTAAAVSGTLLFCDAWFDVLTARGAMDVAQALVSALLVELPLAAACFWIAWRHGATASAVSEDRAPR